MAKVNAPLLSFGAGGQIGQAQVYGKWRGRAYARRYTIPANPRTSAQRQTRDVFRWSAKLWTQLGSEARGPWDTQATGRPILGVNLFTASNVRQLRTKSDLSDLIMSNGARGGFVASDFSVTPTSDGFEVTITPPPVPSGWEVSRVIAVAVEDQDPSENFTGLVAQGSETDSPYTVTLTGLESETSYAVSGFVEYTKPDGKLAYGPSSMIIDDTSA